MLWSIEADSPESYQLIQEIHELVSEYGEAFKHWTDHMGMDDPSDTIARFRDKYVGHYESLDAYARSYMEDSGQEHSLNQLRQQFPEDLREYVIFDYQAYAEQVENHMLVVRANDGNGVYLYNY